MNCVQHYLPEDQPSMNAPDSGQVADLLCYLIEKGQSKMSSWTHIPNTDLEMRLRYWHGVACLLFRKDRTWIYAHIFCYCQEQSELALCLVKRMYFKFRRKMPARPGSGRWIHTVPIHEGNLLADELGLIDEIMQFIYWSIVRLIESGYVPEEEVE